MAVGLRLVGGLSLDRKSNSILLNTPLSVQVLVCPLHSRPFALHRPGWAPCSRPWAGGCSVHDEEIGIIIKKTCRVTVLKQRFASASHDGDESSLYLFLPSAGITEGCQGRWDGILDVSHGVWSDRADVSIVVG